MLSVSGTTIEATDSFFCMAPPKTPGVDLTGLPLPSADESVMRRSGILDKSACRHSLASQSNSTGSGHSDRGPPGASKRCSSSWRQQWPGRGVDAV